MSYRSASGFLTCEADLGSAMRWICELSYLTIGTSLLLGFGGNMAVAMRVIDGF